MARLSIWNGGTLGNTYRYLDSIINEYFQIGGTAIYVHKYLGTYDANGKAIDEVTNIQDLLFLENRDRVYDKDYIELRGIHTMQDNGFDLSQFNIFLNNDTITVDFHLNACIEQIGRKLMNGDVLEFPHLREQAFLDDSYAANKYYVVSDAFRASEGFSQTWFPHVWRVTCDPITDSQEYSDIMKLKVEDKYGLELDEDSTIKSILSDFESKTKVNEKVVEAAKETLPARNFDTTMFYVVKDKDFNSQYPWVYAGDGIPPNGAELIGSGDRFPSTSIKEDDYYLRIDYSPPVLFQRRGKRWARVEIDYRGDDWGMRHRNMESFINNNNETVFDTGEKRPEKVSLSKAFKRTPPKE